MSFSIPHARPQDQKFEDAILAQLHSFAPDIFASGNLLYIGASPLRAQCLAELVAAGRRVTILEIWPWNVDYYRQSDQWQVVCGDVQVIEDLSFPVERYDVAFWWHGPEHIKLKRLPGVLAGIEKRARLVVLGCPWGTYPQPVRYGNVHEQHLSALHPQDFQSLGYRVATLGKAGGRKYSNILAVKP